MSVLEAVVAKLSRYLDLFAGIILAVTAFLVVANILGRALFGRSILGTYEMVGFLTAAVIGLALSRCALEDGHISVGFIVEKLPQGLQRYIDLLIGIPVLAFLFFVAFNLFDYGTIIAASGEVSPTTQIIFYPFIYLVAFGFLVLALTVLVRLLKLFFGGEWK